MDDHHWARLRAIVPRLPCGQPGCAQSWPIDTHERWQTAHVARVEHWQTAHRLTWVTPKGQVVCLRCRRVRATGPEAHVCEPPPWAREGRRDGDHAD